MKSVLEKLNITSAQLNSLFTPCPVDGQRGKHVAALLRERFHLDSDESLGEGLCLRGFLTQEEGRWLDDLD